MKNKKIKIDKAEFLNDFFKDIDNINKKISLLSSNLEIHESQIERVSHSNSTSRGMIASLNNKFKVISGEKK